MSVRIGGTIHCHIEPGQDHSSAESVNKALEILEVPRQGRWTKAHVHFGDGLVITYQPAEGEDLRGVHFASLNCGYPGGGVIDCATVLSMFGFGDYGEIFDKISVGGKYADYKLTPPFRRHQ